MNNTYTDMKTIFTKILLVGLLLGLSNGLMAQKFKKGPAYRYSSWGGTVGTVHYVGDLDPENNLMSPSIRYTKIGFGATYVKKFHPNLYWRGFVGYVAMEGNDYNSTSYRGDDRFRKIRNLNFKNKVIEAKFDFIYDFYGNKFRFQKRHDLVPYMALGIVLFHHNPKGQAENGDWIALQPLMTENKKYSLFNAAIPLTFGVR